MARQVPNCFKDTQFSLAAICDVQTLGRIESEVPENCQPLICFPTLYPCREAQGGGDNRKKNRESGSGSSVASDPASTVRMRGMPFRATVSHRVLGNGCSRLISSVVCPILLDIERHQGLIVISILLFGLDSPSPCDGLKRYRCLPLFLLSVVRMLPGNGSESV
jgi:hypothetical protein